mgnify:CR=1 FL=1
MAISMLISCLGLRLVAATDKRKPKKIVIKDVKIMKTTDKAVL